MCISLFFRAGILPDPDKKADERQAKRPIDPGVRTGEGRAFVAFSSLEL